MPRIQRERTALIVIDMQNGFCHTDGSFAKLGFDISMTRGAIAGCVELVEAAHGAGVPVIYTRYVYQPDYIDGGILAHNLIPAIKESKSLAAGSWDAELVEELRPVAGDVVIDKSRYSAFYGTRLEPILTSLDVASVVLCGVTTNMCVESTARDASQRDYFTFVAADACGELEQARHDQALHTIGFGFGWVVDGAAVLEGWKEPVAAA